MDNFQEESLIDQIEKALQKITYGSLEIVVQDGKVTQITVRNITKTSLNVKPTTNGNGNGKHKISVVKTNGELRTSTVVKIGA